MMIITKESVNTLRERLSHPEELPACQEELQRMLEIKDALLWRAERACSSCSPVGWDMPARLFWETQILREALSALEAGDSARALSLLDEFGQQQEQ